MGINTILVVGAGQMGSGIAQVAALAGYNVYLNDVDEELISKGINTINNNLQKNVEKGKIEDYKKQSALDLIFSAPNLEECKNSDMAIEAIVEDINIKSKVFSKLDALMSPNAILASNTSSLPITEIASYTKAPERVVGMHFMNPVPVMQLVEVISGQLTNDEVLSVTQDVAGEMGKKPVVVDDYPGFVSNRVLMPMINEAVFCVYEGVASPEGIDQVMKLGMNHPMGPLALADLIGLDTCLSIMEVLHDGFGDQKYRPCPLLRRYVNAGLLGKKAGRGFYSYT